MGGDPLSDEFDFIDWDALANVPAAAIDGEAEDAPAWAREMLERILRKAAE